MTDFEKLIGKNWRDVKSTVLASNVVRVLRPSDAMTAEYNGLRLNVCLDENDVVERVFRG